MADATAADEPKDPFNLWFPFEFIIATSLFDGGGGGGGENLAIVGIFEFDVVLVAELFALNFSIEGKYSFLVLPFVGVFISSVIGMNCAFSSRGVDNDDENRGGDGGVDWAETDMGDISSLKASSKFCLLYLISIHSNFLVASLGNTTGLGL
jgi:hypothetical protein